MVCVHNAMLYIHIIRGLVLVDFAYLYYLFVGVCGVFSFSPYKLLCIEACMVFGYVLCP